MYFLTTMRYHAWVRFGISQSVVVADDTFINCVRSIVDHKLLNVYDIYEKVSLYICEERKKEKKQPMCALSCVTGRIKDIKIIETPRALIIKNHCALIEAR